MIKTWFVAAMACVLLGSTGTADAAEVKFLCPIAMRVVMADLIPQFERSSSHKVTIEYASVGVITDRIVKGDAADVAIVSVKQADDLSKQGKIVASSRTEVARVGFGMFVRQGAPKPNIGSVDALKRSLLAAKSIAYADPAGGGPSGIHMAGLIERFGIAAEIKPKTKLLPPGPAVAEAVAKGDAEIGFGVMSDRATSSGVDLVGPLPAEVQGYIDYAGGILTTSKQAEAARALVSFLSSPAGQSALKAKGFEPR
jgi:molybdate transport system substrate-binding protein